jgi:hypothetical protein
MPGDRAAPPPRDSLASPFARILSGLVAACDGFETAVFFDDLGETIDYYSYLDPFTARLIGAHHGVLFASANSRFEWLGAGPVSCLEVSAGRRDSVTVRVAPGYFLTVMVRAGASTDALLERLAGVAAELRAEAGM